MLRASDIPRAQKVVILMSATRRWGKNASFFSSLGFRDSYQNTVVGRRENKVLSLREG